ncbi:hypothetical protein CHS0354_010103 [Potamilus streckersoni]|uniref:Rho GTPase activating protein n=1 Tax=Potamilus streckersoni TaxID=2493646 RepID=A0AAE0RSC8_9BIVA|nr:hypothetical protein CHS0354_010103 [Potamilus streckersoni]
MSTMRSSEKGQLRGWLKKSSAKSLMKTWQQRWFILNGDCLFYFQREDEVKSLGAIFLPGNKVYEIPTSLDEPDKFLFEIVPESHQISYRRTLPTSRQQNKTTAESLGVTLWANSEADRQEWIRAIRHNMYSAIGGAIFGQSISETMKYERSVGKRKVPYLVEQCIEFLTIYGLETEGLFRLPGRTVLIREMKDRFDQGEKVIFDEASIDIHTVASLLKQYIRELPEPLIPGNLYQQLMNCAMRFQSKKEQPEKDEEVQQVQQLMKEVPADNYNMLKYLCQFLFQVAEKSSVNKMDATNLATVFGPNVARHPNMEDSPELFMLTMADLNQQLMFMFINYCDHIFTFEFDNEIVAVDDLLSLDIDTGPDLHQENRSLLKPEVLSKSQLELEDIFRKAPLDQSSYPENDTGPSSKRNSRFIPLENDINDAGETFSKRNGKPIPPERKSRRRICHAFQVEKIEGQIGNVIIKQIKPEPAERTRGSTNEADTTNSLTVHELDSPSNEEHAEIQSKPETGSISSSAEERDETVPECMQSEKKVFNGSLPSAESDFGTVSELKEQVRLLTSELQFTKIKLADVSKSKSKSDSIIKKLQDDLVKTKSTYEEAIKYYDTQITHHKQMMDDLLRKLHEEKNAKAEAVEKIISLQNQLHRYQMRFGELQLSTSVDD